VLFNNELYFYRDLKHRQHDREQTYRNEPPLQLAGCEVGVSVYPKRKNVIYVRQPFGSEYLLQGADEVSEREFDCIDVDN